MNLFVDYDYNDNSKVFKEFEKYYDGKKKNECNFLRLFLKKIGY